MNALIQIKSWVMHHCTWSLMTQMMMLKHYKSSLFYNSFLYILTFCLNWKLFIFYTRGVVDSPQYAVWPLCQGHRFILDVIFFVFVFVFVFSFFVIDLDFSVFVLILFMRVTAWICDWHHFSFCSSQSSIKQKCCKI